jgi:hypothetical protein
MSNYIGPWGGNNISATLLEIDLCVAIEEERCRPFLRYRGERRSGLFNRVPNLVQRVIGKARSDFKSEYRYRRERNYIWEIEVEIAEGSSGWERRSLCSARHRYSASELLQVSTGGRYTGV